MYCTFDVHHVPVLHLNINQFVFSCIPGMIGMRYTWLMCIPVIFFDLRCESVTYMEILCHDMKHYNIHTSKYTCPIMQEYVDEY